ncbi:MAG: IMP cyclohydrolase [Oscillospiraceae bacterium]|jgi:IMP cyclohydrolase|nr:IMP cyclohydrolase [Oscillospiraceae bacterium]
MAYESCDIGAILQGNDYPGRGIILGRSADKAVLAYFIMGRSASSRNRIFAEKGTGLTIYPFDAGKLEDPSLIIYSPVRVLGKKTIVTNGDQTDTVYDFLKQGKRFESALETRRFEPDAPNFTPRISGLIDLETGFSYKLGILKPADASASACSRFTFSYESVPGIGHFIHTYAGNGSPLPSFRGEPVPVAVGNDIDEFTALIWKSLNAENRVSLYVRFIDLERTSFESRLINKNA